MKIRAVVLMVAGAGTVLAQQQMGNFHGMPYELMGRKVFNKQVKGSPYSAQEVTETTQTLADGSHIKNSVSSQIYRDVEGRVRMERTAARRGGGAPTDHAAKSVTIIDPVAGTQIEIDPQAKTARKSSFQAHSFVAETAASGNAKAGFDHRGGHGNSLAAPAAPTVESLGHQSFDGVDAEGTRTTMTIPAGTIGNDTAIQIVNERWYSADLQTTVMSRHVDPRSGETAFRLTGISRANPDASLFQVPSDVQVKDAGAHRMMMPR